MRLFRVFLEHPSYVTEFSLLNQNCGPNGYGPRRSYDEMIMGRNDLEFALCRT